MAGILYLLFQGLLWVIQLYSVLLIIYILMSWVPASRETKFGELLGKLAEPYLGFFRRFIPPLGMIDISPIVGLFALSFISKGVAKIYQMILVSSLM